VAPFAAVAALGAIPKRRVALEVGAGLIAQDHVEIGIRVILPASLQVGEERFLVFEQAVELLKFG
jgi:hypothetical protein